MITLKSIITDTLRIRKIISRKELKQVCRKYGYEESNGERRMRSEVNPVPHIKLNILKKPCQTNEWVAYYQWDGGDTKLKNYEEQSSTSTRKTQLGKESKDTRTNVGNSKKRVDGRETKKTKRKNVTRKKISK